jgi:hypothetical protein
MKAHPKLVTGWAIVDPQRAEDDVEQRAVTPAQSPDQTGWLRWGNGIPKNTPFSQHIAKALSPGNANFKDVPHGDLALAAFGGDRLDGATSLYEFLGLQYERIDTV